MSASHPASTAAPADVPAGFAETASGLIVPEGTQTFEQVTWPTAKVDLLRRVGRFVKSQRVSLMLTCDDERCKTDPMLRRVDVGAGVFVLACHHAIRACVDRKHRAKTISRAFRRRRAKH